jgi:hypothetical protein
MKDRLGRFIKGHIPWNKKDKIEKICKTCKKVFYVYPYRKDIANYCSLKCRPQVFYKGFDSWNKGKKGYINNGSFQNGIKHRNWKGGRVYKKREHTLIYNPKHPFANKGGYIYEHRLVIERHLGRYLNKEEVVHHINKIKTDNRIENLKLCINRAEHIKLHNFLKTQHQP